MNWLITGGCGFIGTSLIKYLQAKGEYRIRLIDNLSTGTLDDLASICSFTEKSAEEVAGPPREIELIKGDILDEKLAINATQGIDVIVHLAANTGVGPSIEDPRSDCYTNIIGTFNYLEAARSHNIKRFVFASSGASIGDTNPPIHEELPSHPVSPYGASKLAGEAYCSAYFRSFNVETVALRFGNAYGPGSAHKSSVVAKFIRRAMDGQPLEIYGDGSQTRDFIYIDDLIAAVFQAATCMGIGGETFQIATSQETTVIEITEQLVSILERKGITGICVVNAEARAGDVIRNYSDTTKAKIRLNWQPAINLTSGLNTTIDYFMENNKS